jgi:hypothetical protein
MSIKGRFLQMEISQQIRITLYIISFCSTIFFVGLFICYSYQVIEQSYQQQKEYFLNMKSSEGTSMMFFQNVNLLLYEETIKLMINQIYNYFYAKQFYISKILFNESYINQHIYNYQSSIESNDSFFYCANENDDNHYNKTYFENNLIKALPIVKIIQNQKSIIFNKSFLSEFVIYDKENNIIFSMNKTKLKLTINDDDIFNSNDNIFFQNLIKKHYERMLYFFQLKVSGLLPMLDLLYSKLMKHFENYYNKTSKEIYSNYTYLLSYLTKSQPVINYNHSLISIIDNINISEVNMIVFNELAYNYINEIFSLIYSFQDKFVAIPVYDDDTLFCKSSCFYFLLFQKFIQNQNISNDDIEKISNSIISGISKIEECFISVNNKYIQFLFDDINNNSIFFFQKQNVRLFNRTGYKMYEILKYGYPSYRGLFLFNPIYIFDNHFFVYLFINFIRINKQINNLKQVLFNCYLGIIICCFILWMIIIIIIIIIEKNISFEVTHPIKKLKQCIETMNLMDDKIFEYPEDNSINELFKTCKELLKGDLYQKKKKTKENYEELNIKNQNLIINNKIISDMIINENIDKIDQDDIQYFEKYRYRKVLEKKRKKLTNEILKNFNTLKEISDFKVNDDNDNINNESIFNSKNNNNICCDEKDSDEELKLYNSFHQLGEIIFDKKTFDDIRNEYETENDNIVFKKLKRIRDSEKHIYIQNKKNILYHWYMNAKKKRSGNIHINKKKKTIMQFKNSPIKQKKHLNYQEKKDKLRISINELKLAFSLENNEINTSKRKKTEY